MKIERIRIVGFKSVAVITLAQLDPYSVFAGPNGAGKSNLMDALAFVGAVIEAGASKAIRKFGGFSQMHCYKFNAQKARTFEFYFDATLDLEKLSYSLIIHDMHANPCLDETLVLDGKTILQRKKGKSSNNLIRVGMNWSKYPVFPLMPLRFSLNQIDGCINT